MIWQFDNDITGILRDGLIIDQNGKPIDVEMYSSVRLWHPIFSTVKQVSEWRTFIVENQISQPFKQAFREIYIVTDAEKNTSRYSNRFAAHILYQHQFTALAKQRNWNYSLQGGFDSHNVPQRYIPKFGLSVEFAVEPIQDSLNDTNIFTYVTSNQVRISNGKEYLEMQDVPAIIFTEVMRDIDLFVGVCSIGNDPEWQDSGVVGDYWQSYSFGELSETANTRKTVLNRILPKLKISDRSYIEGKFLVIEGKIRNYKIHLGSGNILMSPNDQYLCIVPTSKGNLGQIFLPFENDRTLSIILSKAFMLYNDHKIKDSSITSQIQI